MAMFSTTLRCRPTVFRNVSRAFSASQPAVRPRKATARTSRQTVTHVQAMKVGEKLEDSPEAFRVLRASDGSTVSLASFKGKKPVVLFFYPKAGTPGCTTQACSFRDRYEQFTKAGVAVFGISSDSVEDNAAFAKAQKLPYPLLTDASSILRKVFGIKADLMGLLAGRQTFVFDKTGKCVLSFNDQFSPDKHVAEAMKALGL